MVQLVQQLGTVVPERENRLVSKFIDEGSAPVLTAERVERRWTLHGRLALDSPAGVIRVGPAGGGYS